MTTSNPALQHPQDYIGSYLPVGDGQFKFNEGPLLRAVRSGEWLLLDELNLADPAVLSALCPLLEGSSTLAVPGRSAMQCIHRYSPECSALRILY